jgi:hypothetical protein
MRLLASDSIGPWDFSPVRLLADSVRFTPTNRSPIKTRPAVGKGARGKSPWYAALADRRVTRYFHGSDYHEKQSFRLCANGTFYRHFDAGGWTRGGASMAAEQKGAGRWAVRGPMAGGSIALTYSDGTTSKHRIVLQRGKLLVDGKRWYRERAPCR